MSGQSSGDPDRLALQDPEIDVDVRPASVSPPCRSARRDIHSGGRGRSGGRRRGEIPARRSSAFPRDRASDRKAAGEPARVRGGDRDRQHLVRKGPVALERELAHDPVGLLSLYIGRGRHREETRGPERQSQEQPSWAVGETEPRISPKGVGGNKTLLSYSNFPGERDCRD